MAGASCPVCVRLPCRSSCCHSRVNHRIVDERIQAPFTLPTTASQVRTKPSKPPARSTSARPGFAPSSNSGPSSGTTQLAFNTSGTLLLVRSGASPTAVLLYDFPHSQPQQPAASSSSSSSSAAGPSPASAHIGVPRLRTVLLHTQPVVAARWNPDPGRAGRVAVSCGSQSVYLWSDEWVAEPEPEPNRPAGGGQSSVNNDDTEVAECVGVPARRCSLCLSARRGITDAALDFRCSRAQRSSRHGTYAGRRTGRGWFCLIGRHSAVPSRLRKRDKRARRCEDNSGVLLGLQ